MSQYINFYIRTKSGEFISTHDWSRNNYVYRAFEDAPYAKVRKLSEKDIKHALNWINSEVEFYNKHLTRLTAMKNDLLAATNKEDIMDHLNYYYQDVEDIREELEDLKFAENFIVFLQEMKNTFENTDPDKTVPDNGQKTSIWYGIDAPIYPKDKDIIND